MAFLVYMLRCSDGSLYTGITNGLERRLEQHRTGKGSRYVRARMPFRLVYAEEAGSRSEALKRELEIKAMPRQHKLSMVNSSGPHPHVVKE